MTIETLATQGRTKVHTGLAGIETAKLKQIRNQNLRMCFNRLEETHFRREFVARIHGKTFINDAASRSANATWYTLESTEGNIIWITDTHNPAEEYQKITTILKSKVRMIICLGKNTETVHRRLTPYVSNIIDADNMTAAVNAALYNNIEEASVVFSPSCDNGVETETLGKAFQAEVYEL